MSKPNDDVVDPLQSWPHPRLLTGPTAVPAGSDVGAETAVVSLCVPQPSQRPCRAKTARNHNPRVGGTSPSSRQRRIRTDPRRGAKSARIRSASAETPWARVPSRLRARMGPRHGRAGDALGPVSGARGRGRPRPVRTSLRSPRGTRASGGRAGRARPARRILRPVVRAPAAGDARRARRRLPAATLRRRTPTRRGRACSGLPAPAPATAASTPGPRSQCRRAGWTPNRTTAEPSRS